MTDTHLFILNGNDGTGKTTVAKMLCARGCRAIERSDGKDHYGLNLTVLDKLTLAPFLNEALETANLPNSVTIEGISVRVYWIILDADVNTILKRIKDRKVTDLYEKPKSLFYFRSRFMEISAMMGIPLIDTSSLTFEQVVQTVMEVPKYYDEVQRMALRNIDHAFITANNYENHIIIEGTPDDLRNVSDKWDDNPFFAAKLKSMDQKFLKKRVARLLITELRAVDSADSVKFPNSSANFFASSLSLQDLPGKLSGISYKFPDHPVDKTYLLLQVEGESKRVYIFLSDNPYLKGLAVIVLKSTIYSHSMQSTGEIENLGTIRGRGSRIFLELMRRNGLEHSYRAINDHGIILSKFITDITPIEVVVKKYCEGTDKHSFYQMTQNPHVVDSQNQYNTGPYVRFDWRNPNHICHRTGRNVSENPCYYIFEEAVGKDAFFREYLSDPALTKPMGDKTVPESIIGGVLNINQTKRAVLKFFYTIAAYLADLDLEIKDVCFMLDKNGGMFWSEVNQDCMRLVPVATTAATATTATAAKATTTATAAATAAGKRFDKDLWRAGGSSAKAIVSQKWKEFNDIMFAYLTSHSFSETELANYNDFKYQNALPSLSLSLPPGYAQIYDYLRYGTAGQRRVIVTLDLYDQSPVLVRSGKVYTQHSNGDFRQAFQKIGIFPDILVVDLNGAIDGVRKNHNIIKELANRYYIHTGGGLRTIEDVQSVLKESVRRVVLSSAHDDLIKIVPKDRLIVELSINENDEVLIHGRKTNTLKKIGARINELIDLGVDTISITFHKTEGYLQGVPRVQFTRIMSLMPNQIKKVIIAGGIGSMADLEYLWKYERVVPQIGSAIWLDKISIGEIYNGMIAWSSTGSTGSTGSGVMAPMIVQDLHGRNKGLVYTNPEAIAKTCETRKLHRFSREHGRVMLKGEESGNYQIVHQIAVDCDNDALLVTVDTEKPFCHTGNWSCFSMQTAIKANLSTLTEHIQSKMGTTSYTGRMQANPGLALSKLYEEFWELLSAYKENQVSESSDLIVHLLMYLNSRGISFSDILNDLNARRWNPHLIKAPSSFSVSEETLLAITPAKYTDKTIKYLQEQLGMDVKYGEGRSLKISYTIVNHEKYDKYFKGEIIKIITAKPKDMFMLLGLRRIKYAVTYETVIKNGPQTSRAIHLEKDPTVSLALISKKGVEIDPTKWTSDNKGLIAAEHVCHVTDFMHNLGLPQNTYHLDHVIGSSEGLLVNTDKYLMCDAIVESGKTLDDNGLVVWQTIIPKGEIQYGLYGSL